MAININQEKYSPIPTVTPTEAWNSIRQAETDGRTTWTVLRLENKLSMNFINDIEIVSRNLNFKYKDSSANGEKYSAISLQKNYIDEHIREPYYDNVDTSLFTHLLDTKAGKIYYTTPYGLTYDRHWRDKFQQDGHIDNIDFIDLTLNSHLKEDWDTRKLRHQDTTYLILNDFAEIFRPLVSKFFLSQLILYYGRFMRINEEMVSNDHVDGDVRIHIPIYTNETCATRFFHPVSGCSLGTFHMPADGSIYLFNGHMRHQFYNQSKLPRLHAVFLITSMLRPGFSNIFKDFQDLVDNYKRVNKL